MISLYQLLAEAKAYEAAGNLIPGGFGGHCEYSDELEAALAVLAAMVQRGMTEQEQQYIAEYICEALAGVEVEEV